MNIDRVQRRHFAGGLFHHPLHQIDASHFLGDAVLDLQAGIHFEEVKLSGGIVVDELHRAGRLIVNRLPQPHGGLQEIFANAAG